MHYIVRNGSWVAVGQFANSVLSLGLMIAFANLLPKEMFGLYRYILSIAGILNIFTLTGMNSAVSRAVAKGDEGALRPAVVYQLKWNLLMFVASLALGGYYLFQGDTTLAASIMLLGFFVPLTLAFNTYGAYLEGKKMFGFGNILSIVSTFIYSAGMLIALLFTDTVLILIGVYALTTFIPSFIFYLYTIKRFSLSVSEDIEDTKKYGRELTYLRFIDPIVSQIDKIILGSFWGAGQLAIYTLATAVPGRIMLFLKGWVAIGFPKFAAKTPDEINTVFYRRIFQGMLIGLLAAAAYALIAPFLFKYLLPQYLEGLLYSQLLAISFVFAIPNRYISLLFTSQRWSKALFNRTIITSVIQILLYVIFGVFGGILGLVAAFNLNAGIGMLLNIAMWQHMHKRHTMI